MRNVLHLTCDQHWNRPVSLWQALPCMTSLSWHHVADCDAKITEIIQMTGIDLKLVRFNPIKSIT